MFAVKVLQFGNKLVNIFGHIVSLDVGCAVDEEQFFIFGADGFLKGFFAHVQGIGFAACH